MIKRLRQKSGLENIQLTLRYKIGSNMKDFRLKNRKTPNLNGRIDHFRLGVLDLSIR